MNVYGRVVGVEEFDQGSFHTRVTIKLQDGQRLTVESMLWPDKFTIGNAVTLEVEFKDFKAS